MKKNLILLGMMGVGKSTLGKIASKRLGLTFIDTDSLVEKKYSMKIFEIFEKRGENFFRKIEERIVLESLKKNQSIIAVGGGAFMSKNVRDFILKNSISVWLDVNLKTLNKRIKWNNKRPLLNVENSQIKINQLYLKRKNFYKMAKYKINCNSLSKDNIIKKIINFYEKD